MSDEMEGKGREKGEKRSKFKAAWCVNLGVTKPNKKKLS
jgi:hypothetical protein